jgi:hypothetical protein
MVDKPEGDPNAAVAATMTGQGLWGVSRPPNPHFAVPKKNSEELVVTRSVSLESLGLVPKPGLLERLFGSGRESFPNTPFKPSEREDIGKRLDELMTEVTKTREELGLATGQLEAMKMMLDETRKASEASERIGRKDWLLLGIGAVASLAISVAFPPAAVVHITGLFIHKVGHLFVEELAG